MSGRNDGGKGGAGRSADEQDTPVSDAEAEGAESTESGYRRDDYWREEAREGGTGPADVPEPAQGYAFETAEEKAKADDGDENGADEGPGAEQGNAGGRDDARIVDD